MQFWHIVRPLFFKVDAEAIHEHVMRWLALSSSFVRAPLESQPSFHFGVRFPNRVGLAAGFDKNARCLVAWQNLGFGFVEVGTVTALAQSGNPKPRIFRYPEQAALLNRMGFNNHGAQVIAERIAKQRTQFNIKIPIGINIGKSRVVDLEQAHLDYQKSFSILADLADYVVANVSSPNTPGLRQLQDPQFLRVLLETLADQNARRQKTVPLVLKLSSDLSVDAALQAAELALEFGFQALVLGNTSTQTELLEGTHKDGAGGISGKPIFELSTRLLSAIHAQFNKRLTLIASGGIMSPEDAEAKFQAGADLLQVYTGFVYGGPGFARELVRHFAQRELARAKSEISRSARDDGKCTSPRV